MEKTEEQEIEEARETLKEMCALRSKIRKELGQKIKAMNSLISSLSNGLNEYDNRMRTLQKQRDWDAIDWTEITWDEAPSDEEIAWLPVRPDGELLAESIWIEIFKPDSYSSYFETGKWEVHIYRKQYAFATKARAYAKAKKIMAKPRLYFSVKDF